MGEEFNSLYDERFVDIFEKQTSTYLSRIWKQVPGSKSPVSWCEDIKTGTPPALVALLDRDTPPSFCELEVLRWEATADAGDHSNTLCVDSDRGSAQCRVFQLRLKKASHETPTYSKAKYDEPKRRKPSTSILLFNYERNN